jgi:repressor LexA
MHTTQEKILELAKHNDLTHLSYREIGDLIGEGHPQKIKHHLFQLLNKGLVVLDDKSHAVTVTNRGKIKNTSLYALPIVGSANCGPATMLASDNIEGYLKVSGGILGRKSAEDLFVVQAKGDSMDAANVKGATIEDGDYVVIDLQNRTPKNGDYVLSVVDGSANLKRFYKDEAEGRVALVSESSKNIPPIYLHQKDFVDYMVNGIVVGVIKKPKFAS